MLRENVIEASSEVRVFEGKFGLVQWHLIYNTSTFILNDECKVFDRRNGPVISLMASRNARIICMVFEFGLT